RLARGGSKKRPFYRIVVANSRSPRDGDFIEKIGTYNPLLSADNKDRISLKIDRITYWLNQGAQLSDKVLAFVAKSGITLPEYIKKEISKKKEANAVRLSKKAEKKSEEEAA
ncbi:MAG: 30S ribosomal protein S16, partial [Rickettsiaceae bacterium]|nr:30S ribosomal protein S16 [Rickettsiaceae bacterium]